VETEPAANLVFDLQDKRGSAVSLKKIKKKEEQLYQFEFCKLHISTASGKKAASLIGQETNEHPTLNIQHRIMYSVNLIID
jgi:hypothetical protein